MSTVSPTIIAALSLVAIAAPAPTSASAPSPSLESPAMANTPDCPPMSDVTAAALAEMRSSLLTPGKKVDLAKLAQSPVLQAARVDEEKRRATDWPNLCRYQAGNRLLAGQARPDVVFIGDSITENWAAADPTLLDGRKTIGRGIGGQTSPQILVRFYADVVALHPRAVHIMAGTNDVAGNTGPSDDAWIENNLRAMTEIAQANGIRVILASIPPARSFPWSPGSAPAPRIARLNAFIRGYAQRSNAVYVDYHQVLDDGIGGMKHDLGNDGVHPNLTGYAAMRPLVEAAIRQALR